MNKFISALILTMVAFVASATEADLKAYIATGTNYLDRSNVGWKMQAGGKVCDAMKSVGLGCSYNDRVALVDFLFKNGKSLFPCEGNTSPYFNTKLPPDDVGNCSHPSMKLHENNYYVGRPIQNELLAKAVIANRGLFKNGNLTAENAKKWKM